MTGQLVDKPEHPIIWTRKPLFPLRQAFSRLLFGNLENHLVLAAKRGDSPAVLTWLDRGADIAVAGAEALRVAADNGNNNTVGLLLDLGVDAKSLPPGSSQRPEYSLSVPSERRSPVVEGVYSP